jgi:hypothetical protein
LQAYVLSVLDVSEVCFICIFWTHVASVFIWMLHMFTHTLHVFYLDVAYGCNGFQVFSGVFSSVLKACFKCFHCLQTYVATVVFGCFKSRSGVASLLPTFCYIVSPGVGRASIRRHGWVLLNRRRRTPFPSCRSGSSGPAWSAERSAARGTYDSLMNFTPN